MNFEQWYTDTVDVYRVVPTKSHNLTKNTRQKIYSQLPCRIYRSENSKIRMDQTAAGINEGMNIALDNKYVIKAGDELIVFRGGGLGKKDFKERAFAGDPHYHFEPFGGVFPKLSHQEIQLLKMERVE